MCFIYFSFRFKNFVSSKDQSVALELIRTNYHVPTFAVLAKFNDRSFYLQSRVTDSFYRLNRFQFCAAVSHGAGSNFSLSAINHVRVSRLLFSGTIPSFHLFEFCYCFHL